MLARFARVATRDFGTADVGVGDVEREDSLPRPRGGLSLAELDSRSPPPLKIEGMGGGGLRRDEPSATWVSRAGGSGVSLRALERRSVAGGETGLGGGAAAIRVLFEALAGGVRVVTPGAE